MKKYVADEKMQYDIRHDPKNVIDLDAPSDEEEEPKSDNSLVAEDEVNKPAAVDLGQSAQIELAST